MIAAVDLRFNHVTKLNRHNSRMAEVQMRINVARCDHVNTEKQGIIGLHLLPGNEIPPTSRTGTEWRESKIS
jgi:hypothetical protein